MLKKKKKYLYASLLVTALILVLLIFTFCLRTKDNSINFEINGPYVGYIENSVNGKINIYTEKGGEYVTSVPIKMISNFLGKQPELSYKETYLNAYFYCGSKENLEWTYVVSKPTFFTSIVNYYALYGEESVEICCYDITAGGIVTGAAFVSDMIGFIGLQLPTDIGFEIYTTQDSGRSWNPIEVAQPDGWLDTSVLVPVSWESPYECSSYPFILNNSMNSVDDRKIIYLTTDNDGESWYWSY